MVAETKTIFNGTLQPTGTTTDSFTSGDYFVLITPTLQDDIEIDTFLQLIFGNVNRLIPLQPYNVLDTNTITLLPPQFSNANGEEMYLFIVPSEPVNAEIIVINHVKVQVTEDETETNDVLESVLRLTQLANGDISQAVPLLNDIASTLNPSLDSIPSSADSIREITTFYGL